jgi:hypothetical protein
MPPIPRRIARRSTRRTRASCVRSSSQHPDDLEAATLYAEALMDLSPWDYWTAEGEPRPDTPEMLAQLERVIAANPDHPGANHFYIHAVEAVQPERAVAAPSGWRR